jgi:hypothetical protein
MTDPMDFDRFFKETSGVDDLKWAGKPHGSIQWKGTDVCMDIDCSCGAHSHIDADFFYHFECNECHRKFMVSPNVALVELTPEQADFVSNSGKVCEFLSEPND